MRTYIVLKLITFLFAMLPDRIKVWFADGYVNAVRRKYLINDDKDDPEKQVNSVRVKFDELKEEIKNTFEKNKDEKTLDLTCEDTQWLVESGYIDRKLQSFMFVQQFSQKELNEFYSNECAWISMQYVGPLSVMNPDPTVNEIIDGTKNEAVRCVLWYELYNLIAMLKGENVTRN